MNGKEILDLYLQRHYLLPSQISVKLTCTLRASRESARSENRHKIKSAFEKIVTGASQVHIFGDLKNTIESAFFVQLIPL